MAVNTAYLAWGMRRLIAGRATDIRDMATRSWEVCPAETLTCPSAIHLPDALDRVTALSPWRDWETERLYIEGGPVMHAATRAHLIQNVNIDGAFLYCGAAKLRAGFGPQQLTHRHSAPRRNLPEAHLVSDWAGSHYFGLFLRASLPMELLPDTAENMISLPTKDYTHEAGYRKILERPRPPCVTAARVNRLILYNDFGHNRSKAARYAELRAALRKNLGGIAPQGKTGVYLKRGATGEPRRIANESQVEATLTALGFDIVEPETLDARTIAQRLLDAPIVVSVEGSHLSHAIYSIAEGGTLLVLQPPDRFAMAFKEFTNRGGLNFAFTVGHAAPDGFTVNPDDIKRTLDLLS